MEKRSKKLKENYQAIKENSMIKCWKKKSMKKMMEMKKEMVVKIMKKREMVVRWVVSDPWFGL